MKLRIGWTTALLSCLAAPSVAAAGPSFGTQASAAAGDKNSGSTIGAESATAREGYSSDGGSANAVASASIGDLSVDTIAAPSFHGNVSAIAFADFFDTLTVTGPAGDIAHFSFGLRTDAVVSPGGESGNGSVDASLSANGVSVTITLFSDTTPKSATAPPPAFISAPVGQTIFLSGELSAGTVGAFLAGPSTARDPLQVFIDPLTPNMAYVAASGFIYPTSAAIPEPSTWAMMLVGFAGLAFAGYRARVRPALVKGT
jgi:PEP-CTERM motif